MGIARNLKNLMSRNVEAHYGSWKNDLATVQYQRIDDTPTGFSESVVVNQKGREKDTLEVTYDRKVLTDGSELETLEAQAGFEEKRKKLVALEVFFLKIVEEAMRKAFEE